MNNVVLSYEPTTAQVIMAGREAGPAGEAALVPAPGVHLAFDRADGYLVRGIVDVDRLDADRLDAGSDGAALLLARLFGPHARDVLLAAASPSAVEPATLSPEPGLSAKLSSLARLDAARATSPVAASPRWAAESAALAREAALTARARADGRRAGSASADPPYGSRPPVWNVAAELESLRGDRLCVPPGLHWVLDPVIVPAQLFQFGLTPHDDLLVRYDVGGGYVVVEIGLGPGVRRSAAAGWLARLVDPAAREVLVWAHFDGTGSRLRADLKPPSPLTEPGETWIEVVEDPERPVRSVKAHRIARALRWADAALRAERAPLGLAPASPGQDWAALAAEAWERCRRDWEAAGYPARAAASLGRVPGPGPACRAESRDGLS
jgi:hypothetical protein